MITDDDRNFDDARRVLDTVICAIGDGALQCGGNGARACLFCGDGDSHEEGCIYWRGAKWLWKDRDANTQCEALFGMLAEIGSIDPMRAQHPWYPHHAIWMCVFCESTALDEEHRLGCPWLMARALVALPTAMDRRAILLLPTDIRGCFVYDISQLDASLKLYIDTRPADIPSRYRIGDNLLLILVALESLTSDFPIVGSDDLGRLEREGTEIFSYELLPRGGARATGLEIETSWGKLIATATEFSAQTIPRR